MIYLTGEIFLCKYKCKQHSFNLRKIKQVEMKYILERKELRFSLKKKKKKKLKGITVSNNS